MLDCFNGTTVQIRACSLARPSLHLAREEYRLASFHSIPSARHPQTPIRVRGSCKQKQETAEELKLEKTRW
jgi:hypothetical protein